MFQVTRIEQGMKFGRLTVLGLDHRDKAKDKTYFKCLCECGKEAIVERYKLKSGYTRSCGCLRADSMAMRRGPAKKVELSERAQNWIIKHYKHTKNQDIKEKYGLSDGWLHRFARQHGLKKSSQFMHKCQAETTRAAYQSHLVHGTRPPKGYRIPGSEQHGFQKGVTNVERLGPARKAERVRKSAEGRRKTWKLEHARMTFGLPRETKLRVFKQPREWAIRRYRLKQYGYMVERGALDVYYTPQTSRRPNLEGKPFRFHEMNLPQ